MLKTLRTVALACVCSFSLHLAMAQQPQAPAQQAAAAVAEPEAPRVVLQGESTAPVLRLMKFSGLLRDGAGNARTGVVGLTFAIYKEQQGGSPLWLEVHNALLDEQGRYTVLLGSTKSDGLPLELFSTGEARWLGVQLNLPGEEEQPRVLLVSVPYALKAADAETLGGKPPSAFLLAEPVGADPRVRSEAGKEAAKEGPRQEGVVGTITGEGTTNMVSKFTGANTIGDGSLFDNGFVGVGNTNPFGKLTVTHPLSGSVTKALLLESHYDLNSGAKIVFDSLSNNGERASLGYSIVSGGGGDIFFNTSQQGGFPAAERMRITNTGSVGIGSSNPFGKLTVTNPVAGSVSKGLLLESHYDLNSGSKIVFDSLSNNGERASIGYAIVSGGGGDIFFNTSPQGGFPVAERMRITSSGSIIANGLRVLTTADTPNVIGGFSGNTVSGGLVGATISGGGHNDFPNSVTGGFGTVGGGQGNTAGVAGHATVGGGQINTASGVAATVGGGALNSASSPNATVGGGQANTASNFAATVPGGNFNTAGGQYSFAAGRRAKALHDGAFVWGDSTDADIASTGPNQFLVRASGGAVFQGGVQATGNLATGSQLVSTIGTGTAPLAVSSTTKVTNLNADQLDGMDSTAFAPASGSGNYVAKSGDTMAGTLNLPANGLVAGANQLVLAGGKVGIGTASPTSVLHLVGSQPPPAFLFGTPATRVLQITGGKGGNAGSTADGGMGADINITAGAGGDGPAGGGGHGGSITLQPGAPGIGAFGGGNFGSVFLATDGGRVSIGTSSFPLAKLQILENSGLMWLGHVGCGAGFTGIAFSISSSTVLGCNGYSLGGNGTDTILNRSTGGGILFRENNVTQMSIAAGGAVNISGNLTVGGTLSKGAGSFKIDHPVDPANKYLSHSFVESPDMMNIYNGNVRLDGNGEAWVELPEWFEALNRDFRYQLTAIGAPGPNLYIAQEVSGNRFKIAGGRPGSRVSWQVTGVRRDAYANAYRIKVEEEKPLTQRGSYLHPELFGPAKEKGFESAPHAMKAAAEK